MTQYSKGQRGKTFRPRWPVSPLIARYGTGRASLNGFSERKNKRDTAIEAEIVRAANAAIEAHEPKLRRPYKGSLQSYEKELENEAA